MDREPDVEIRAAVRAAELRFECKPDVDIVAWSDTPASAESSSERENLPDELEEGVSYRDFAVRWRVSARLEDPEPATPPTSSGERRPHEATRPQ